MTAVTDGIAARLADPSPEVRRRAVRDLVGVGARDGADLILAALGDDDWRVRKETILVVAELKTDDDLVRRLIAALLQEDDVGLRNGAAEALASTRGDVVTPLIGALDAAAPGGRKIILEVVGRTGDQRAVATLVRHLTDPDPNVKVCVAELLGDHPTAEAIDALCRCLGPADSLLSLAALQSVNRMGARIPWTSLEPLAGDPLLASEIFFAMARTGEPAAAAVIGGRLGGDRSAARAFEVLHDASAEAAAAVEEVMTRVGEGTLDKLSILAGEEESPDRRAAVRCIIWSRRPAMIPLLVRLSADEALNRTIVDGLFTWGALAVDALERMLPDARGRTLASVINLLSKLLDERQGRDKAALFTAYLNSADVVVATSAAGAVARFGTEAVIPRLLELAADDDLRVRRVAGYALTQIGCRYPSEVRSSITSLEMEGPRGVELCRVFEVVGRPEDLGVIASALSSPDALLRRNALGTLAAVAGPSAVDTISLAMTDEDTGVKMAAASALARIGPAAAETIVSALNTAEGPLRAALVRALGKVGHIAAPAILRSMCRESSDVAMAALEAMRNLELDPGELKSEVLGHVDKEVVKKALAFLGPAVSVPELAALLAHEAWDIRLAVVERLTAMAAADEAAADPMRARLLVEDDDLVRASLERALTTGKGSR